MSDFPKDGSTFVLESIDRIAYRWAKYKPDGARQMGKPGRWQKQVWNGDWFKWENCEAPVGELSPPIEDGPISKAFKQAGALEHWRQEVGKLHSQIAKLREENDRLRGARDLIADWIIEGTEDLPDDTGVTIKIGNRSLVLDELKNLRRAADLSKEPTP